ncbi:LacI family DNA-binding transcriptional regulator [Stygiobacter electus]|uniref:LacI family DNA-binding transcriptional regulator n=1 Tax=Stygiobacter electus TaxID=3032292 RepID=A0AAE3TDL4_9BACT|nr:LacI family DNA-binding transcriptional regulator [Stygiobacter electus]MDF1613065.1 LacI family DNA-binding transcriptional regulator [Stygiobacter electus]
MLKKSTLQYIAEKAKVSRMTVSRVFSGEKNVSKKTSEKIKKIAKRVGYHPNLIARSLSKRKSNTIGIFVPKTRHLFLDVYITQLLSGISDVTQEHDFRLMLFPIDYKKSESDLYLSIARSHLVDGIILIKTKIKDDGLEELKSIKFPFVLVNHRNNKYNFIDSNNIKGTKLAIEHLYNLGHRKIAFVSGSLDETNAIDRLNSYKRTMKKLNLPIKKEWIINGEFSKEKAYEESKKLFNQKDLPTAIFCSDDYMAIGVIERIKESGLSVPRDISVVGFDNIEISSYVNPPLTTVHQPISMIGEKAANLLIDLINEKKSPPIHELLDTQLVIRKSTSRMK